MLQFLQKNRKNNFRGKLYKEKTPGLTVMRHLKRRKGICLCTQ